MEFARQNLSGAEDVVLLRRATRNMAEILGLGQVEQTKLAAAASEIARAVLENEARCLARFSLEGRVLTLQVERGPEASDRGPIELPEAASRLAGVVRPVKGGLRLDVELGAEPSPETLSRIGALSLHEGNPLEELREQNEALLAALEERRRFEARLALASETADLGVVFVDLETREVEANARARSLQGVGSLNTFEALLESIEEGGETVSSGFRSLRVGEIALLEATYRTRGGRWVLIRARREPGTERVNATLLDVSQQKRDEQEQRRRAEMQQMMMGVASHDLRSPLQTIQTGVALMKELYGDEKDAERILRRIDEASVQAARLVSDFLDYTQAHLGGGLPIDATSTDLFEIARGVASSAGLGLGSSDVVVAGHPAPVHGDTARLTQAITNLVENALAHRQEGTTIRIEAGPEDDEAVLRVTNQGEPIPPEAVGRIFEPFARAQESKQKGLGLGLHIVNLVAEAHGGHAGVRSQAGEATTFELRLPLGVGDSGELESAS